MLPCVSQGSMPPTCTHMKSHTLRLSPAHWVCHSEADLLDIMFKIRPALHLEFFIFSVLSLFFLTTGSPLRLRLLPPSLMTLLIFVPNLLLSLDASHLPAARPCTNQCHASLSDHASVWRNISCSWRKSLVLTSACSNAGHSLNLVRSEWETNAILTDPLLYYNVFMSCFLSESLSR